MSVEILEIQLRSNGAKKESDDLWRSFEKLETAGNAVSGSFDKINAKSASAATGLDRAASHSDKLTKSLEGLVRTRSYIETLFALLAGAGVIGQTIKMADEYRNLDARLKLATKSQAEFNAVQASLFAMADNNRQSLTATVDLYSGIAPALKEAGRSYQEVLTAVDSVNKALVVGGATAEGADASIRQLTQALGSGVLRGDEFNSIMENGRGIAIALAEGLGVPIGKLRELAMQGKLTAEIVTQALIDQNDAIGKKFSEMPVTVGQALQVVQNNITRAVGEADAYTGATKALSEALIFLSRNLDSAANLALVVASIYGGKMVTAMAGYVVMQYRAVTATAEATAASNAQVAANLREVEASATVAISNQRVAEFRLRNAQAAEAAALSTYNQAKASAAAAATELEFINTQNLLTASSVRLVAAQEQVAIATIAATEAQNIAAASSVRLSASQATLAASSGALTVASRGLSAALAMMGGPVGVIMLLVGAVIIYHDELMGLVDGSAAAKEAEELHAKAMDEAKKATYEYANASASLRKELEEQRDSSLDAARASVEEARAAVTAAQAKLEIAKKQASSNIFEHGSAGLVVETQNDVTRSESVLEASLRRLNDLEKTYANFGKSKEELDRIYVYGETEKASAVHKTAQELLAATSAGQKSAKVSHDHADAIRSVIESLQQQRIELEYGKAAAEYYAARLKGLTDAEARAAAGASQYNTYLAERKKLQDAALERGGDLAAIYRNQLEEAGLGDISSQFDEIKSSTDAAVDAANKYQAALEAASKAGESMGSNVSAAITSSVDASVKASSKLVAEMQKQASAHAQSLAAISNVSASSGLDANMMKTMAWIESRFNESAYNKSSASGLWQFVNSTASQYGISGQQFDPVASTQAYVKLLNDNMAGLKKYGIQVTEANLYLAHQQGVGGLKQIMDEAAGRGTMSATVRKNMLNNRPDNMQGSSASAFLDAWQQKYATINASIKQAFGGTQQIAQATDQAAQSTGAMAVSTVRYSGEVDKARVSQQQVNDLVSQYMQGQADELIKKAEEHRKEIEMGASAYREMELALQGFSASQVQAISEAENAAKFAEMQQGLEEQYQQLVLNADAYRNLQLAREGFTEAQTAAIVATEKEISRMKEVRGAIDNLGAALSNTFEKAIDSGKLRFDDLKDWLKQTFNTLVLSPIIQAIVSPIQGVMQSMLMPGSAGVMSGAMQSAGGAGGLLSGGGMLSGGLSGIQNMIFGNSIGSAFGNVGSSLGTSLFSGAAGYSNLMYGGAGLLGGLFGQAAFGGQGGIGGGLGATLGMAIGGPIGALAGGLLGGLVGGLFGGDRQDTGHGVQLSYGSGSVTGKQYTSWSEDGGWFNGDSSGTDYTALDSAITDKLDAYFKQATDSIQSSAEYLGYAASTSVLDGFTAGAVQISTDEKSEQEIQQAIQDWANGVTDSMYTLVFGADFEKFRLEGEDTTTMFSRLLVEIQSVDAFSKHLGLTFGLTGKAAADAADTMALAAGGIQNLNSLVETYYQNFYSDQERLQNQYLDGKSVLMAFNEQMGTTIDSKDALRSFVDSLDLTTEAGQKAFASAMQLAPALVSMTQAQEALLKQTLDLRSALLDIQGSDLSILTPVQKLDDARQQFEDLYAKALTGDQDAISSISGQGKALLQLSRAYNASGAVYTTDYERVSAALVGLADGIDASIRDNMGVTVSAADVSFDQSDSFEHAADSAESMANAMDNATTAMNSIWKKFATAFDSSANDASANSDTFSWLFAHALDGSHADGLPSVPYDGYRAELHKDEAVIDASTMFALRRYGIPVNAGSNDVDNRELIAEIRALRAEVSALRSDANRNSATAASQRDTGNRKSAEIQAELAKTRQQQRNETRMKGSKGLY